MDLDRTEEDEAADARLCRGFGQPLGALRVNTAEFGPRGIGLVVPNIDAGGPMDDSVGSGSSGRPVGPRPALMVVAGVGPQWVGI